MDITKKVDKDFIADLVAKTGFNQALLSKDYFITTHFKLKTVKESKKPVKSVSKKNAISQKPSK